MPERFIKIVNSGNVIYQEHIGQALEWSVSEDEAGSIVVDLYPEQEDISEEEASEEEVPTGDAPGVDEIPPAPDDAPEIVV